ncbi:YtzI protein [Lentibacillus juripiscarius]|uniref:YtzI protein n=1 Tax=Lentibacillus juripiscarius TaxID=257446 RepID=A0ABW5V2J7_9BACI
MTGYIVTGVVIMLTVMALTLIAISKGYDYKHTVDPLPADDEEKKNVESKEDRAI